MQDYVKVGWKDSPSTDSPVSAANLIHMENGILQAQIGVGEAKDTAEAASAAAQEASEAVEGMEDRVGTLEDQVEEIKTSIGNAYVIETYGILASAAAGSHTFDNMSSIIAVIGSNYVSATQPYGHTTYPDAQFGNVTINGNTITWQSATAGRQLVVIGLKNTD